MSPGPDVLRVGLTGNAAAGKSTVARWLESWGATLIDADALVRESQAPGSPVLDAIARAFGADVLDAGGQLKRAVLRGRVMGIPDALVRLNEIVHPAVQSLRTIRESEALWRGDCIVIHDIPLLFEVLDPNQFDVVVLVDAPEQLRRERLKHERGLSDDEVTRIVASQQPAKPKRHLAGIVIDNTGSVGALEATVRVAWNELRVRAATHAAGAHPPRVILAVDQVTPGLVGLAARAHTAGSRLVLAPPCVGTSDVLASLASEQIASLDPNTVRAAGADDERLVIVCDGPGSDSHTSAMDALRGRPYVVGWPVSDGDPTRGARIDVRPWRDSQEPLLGGSRDAPIARVCIGVNAPPTTPVFDLAHLTPPAG